MGRKILLVEDDRETAAYLANGLTQEGHSVEQSTNGQDGLFRATSGSFDLIILDRMLPGLDGISVLRALRAAISKRRCWCCRRWPRSAIESKAWKAVPTIIS